MKKIFNRMRIRPPKHSEGSLVKAGALAQWKSVFHA